MDGGTGFDPLVKYPDDGGLKQQQRDIAAVPSLSGVVAKHFGLEPQPEPNWRSMYYDERHAHVQTRKKLENLRENYDALMNDWLES
jgi:hypothetical protein